METSVTRLKSICNLANHIEESISIIKTMTKVNLTTDENLITRWCILHCRMMSILHEQMHTFGSYRLDFILRRKCGINN